MNDSFRAKLRLASLITFILLFTGTLAFAAGGVVEDPTGCKLPSPNPVRSLLPSGISKPWAPEMK